MQLQGEDDTEDLAAAVESCFKLTCQFRNDKIVYRRYAGLFFCVCVDSNDNELAYLEAIHLFVEVLGECASVLASFLRHPLTARCLLPERMRARPRLLLLQGEFSTAYGD